MKDWLTALAVTAFWVLAIVAIYNEIQWVRS